MELLKPLEEIENTILAIGSHDITLDLLGDLLKRKHPELSLASAHVGSLGGLTALKRGEAHLAGTHLLDEETGEYNLSTLRRLFPQGGIALITLCYRQQGLIVSPGNPKDVQGLRDLVEQGLVYINRQRGSGTRILLDYELQRQGLDAAALKGYERELFTHLAVAAAVASGAADCGLGILAAAQALQLDFLPLAEERYDLAIPEEFLALPRVRAVLDLIVGEEFRAAVEKLGGYDLREVGRRVV
jgi:putative molybdopterin biosynthesis protein